MYSEYGTGTDVYLCDNNASFLHRICTSPFTGLAALPMTWDSQFDEQGGWHHLQIINDLMDGIQLDNEKWTAGIPMVQADNSVEVFYLRNNEEREDSKLIGAISNRTYNYFTQGDTLPCHFPPIEGEIFENAIYQLPNSFITDVLSPIKFTNMGVFKGYQIDWISPITGDTWSAEKISDAFGHLKLELPTFLTGSHHNPIMVFKIYRIDAEFLSPIVEDSFQTSLPSDFSNDEECLDHAHNYFRKE
jgi:hypothetical protein